MVSHKQIILLLLLILFHSCSEEKIDLVNFKGLLNDPCMILNQESDNSIEGTYLIIQEIDFKKKRFKVNLPEFFFVNNSNCKDWMFGWGKNIPLYDAGVENLRTILKIDIQKKWIYYGQLLRGNSLPKLDQRIVFWNKNPSNFVNNLRKPIIDFNMFKNFSGNSLAFSSVVYDSTINSWSMILHECDHQNIQIYAAVSKDLIHWSAVNDGRAILTEKDFLNTNWCGWDQTGIIRQAPFVSDIILKDKKWYLFMDGYSSNGKRSIGIAISKKSVLGPYKILKKSILSPGSKGNWNDHSVFYAKVKKYKNGFILFFDGRNFEGRESVGRAFSKDLVNWEMSVNNPVIDLHSGWRSNIGSSEPNHIEFRQDSIILMVSGVKYPKMGFWHHYITGKMYKDVSGNVDDAQLGSFLSIDGGNSFRSNKNNPIFTNDYSNKYENSHMGGNFKYIKTDTSEFIIYQAKTDFKGTKYSVFLRERKFKVEK